MTTRPATWADLEPIAWVLIEAAGQDPNYPYRFPKRPLYPEDFETRCLLKCAEYLRTATVIVYELPSNSDPGVMQVVAFSVWTYEGPHDSGPSIAPSLPWACTVGAKNGDIAIARAPGRDANPARMKAFLDACANHKAKFFDKNFPEGYIFLKLLICHPAYQRRGAGRSLTRWGINRAREMGLPTALFSSPLGLKLYKKLDFSVVGKFRVRIQGEADSLEIPALVLESGESPARGLDEGVDNTTLVVQSV